MLPAIELVVTALAGTQMGFEASSLFVDEGDKPRIGQAFWPSIGAPAGSEVYKVRFETCFRPCCRTKMSACQAYRRRDLAHRPGRKD